LVIKLLIRHFILFIFFFFSELETTRTSSSLPLAKEKDILRQIAQIKKAKILYEENKVHEQLIQDKKVSDDLLSLS
jgi:uncharacterized membrane protein